MLKLPLLEPALYLVKAREQVCNLIFKNHLVHQASDPSYNVHVQKFMYIVHVYYYTCTCILVCTGPIITDQWALGLSRTGVL